MKALLFVSFVIFLIFVVKAQNNAPPLCCPNTPICEGERKCQFNDVLGYICVDPKNVTDTAVSCAFDNQAVDPGCNSNLLTDQVCVDTRGGKGKGNCDFSCVSRCNLFEDEDSCERNQCQWNTANILSCSSNSIVDQVGGCTQQCNAITTTCAKNEQGQKALWSACLPHGWEPIEREDCECEEEPDDCDRNIGLTKTRAASCSLSKVEDFCIKDSLCKPQPTCAMNENTEKYWLFPTNCLPEGFKLIPHTDKNFCKCDCSCKPDVCEGKTVILTSESCNPLLGDRKEEFCVDKACEKPTTEELCVLDKWNSLTIPRFWTVPADTCLPERFVRVDPCHCDCTCLDCNFDALRRRGKRCRLDNNAEFDYFDYCHREEDSKRCDVNTRVCMFDPKLDETTRRFYSFEGCGPSEWERAKDCFCNCPNDCAPNASPCQDGYKVVKGAICGRNGERVARDGFCVPENVTCRNEAVCGKKEVKRDISGVNDDSEDLYVLFEGCLPAGWEEEDLEDCECEKPECEDLDDNQFTCVHALGNDCKWCNRFSGDLGVCDDDCEGNARPICSERLEEDDCKRCLDEKRNSSWQWCEVRDKEFCAPRCPTAGDVPEPEQCNDRVIPRIDCIIDETVNISVACVGFNNDGDDNYVKLEVTDDNDVERNDKSAFVDVDRGNSASYPRCKARIAYERDVKTCFRSCDFRACVDRDTPRCPKNVKFIVKFKLALDEMTLERLRDYLSSRFDYPRALIILRKLNSNKRQTGTEVEVEVHDDGSGSADAKANQILDAIDNGNDGIDENVGTPVDSTETVGTGTETTGKSVSGSSDGSKVLGFTSFFVGLCIALFF